MCFEQDFNAISAGEFSQPWDSFVRTPTHRQYSPQYAVRQTSRFVKEAIGTLSRRSRQQPEDIGIWLGASSKLYPEYYLNNFHYQTDGWFSSRSANVYETSTETLFVGRQDAMQRTTLRPLAAAKVREANNGQPRVLEVACGTGRFATFLRDCLPGCEYTGVDLSPFYLEAARGNDAYWRKVSSGGKTEKQPPARFVQAAAEDLPFEENAFDAVVCVYLFHEMPAEARAAAALEMARVVRPGGVVVLTDSMQRGDRPVLDERLGNFANLNEPHYVDYVDTELAPLFTAGGLQCGTKYVASSTKTLSFTKPVAEDPQEASTAGATEQLMNETDEAVTAPTAQLADDQETLPQ